MLKFSFIIPDADENYSWRVTSERTQQYHADLLIQTNLFLVESNKQNMEEYKFHTDIFEYIQYGISPIQIWNTVQKTLEYLLKKKVLKVFIQSKKMMIFRGFCWKNISHWIITITLLNTMNICTVLEMSIPYLRCF